MTDVQIGGESEIPPEAGDSSNILLYGILLMVSMLGMGALVRKRKQF
jgi:LPXTG-motif cell wall-anchored protein